MSSSSFIMPVLNREMLSSLTAILEELPIVSIEYTALREKGQETLLRIEILFLLKEKKDQIT